MRQVVVGSLSDSILIDEIIGLIFNLQKPDRVFIAGSHWLPTALKNTDNLRLQYPIIYVYAPAVDEEGSVESGDIQN
jgi:hypothetical protein